MYYVGVDLAWSDNNRTGVAVIQDDKLVMTGTVKTDKEIVRAVTGIVGRDACLVAIDAPLVVPNENGSRVAEKLTNQLFRQYEAGAHPANRSWLTRSSGRVRGEDIVQKLEEVGIRHDPSNLHARARKCFEVYPHPAMVVLFGLDKTLKYKPRQNRSYEERWQAFEDYQDHLRDLPFTPGTDVLKQDVRELRASALKDYEDRLDAIFCAYISKYAHEHPSDVAVLGDMREGYILTPVFEHQRTLA